MEKRSFRSLYVVKEIPHYFCSKNLLSEEIPEVLMALLNSPEVRASDLEFSIKEYNTKKRFLAAKGSKEYRQVLPHPFLCAGSDEWQDPCGLNSPSKLLRWWYPAGMLVNSPEEIPSPEEIKKRKYVDLEALLQENYVVLDTEIEGWEDGHDRIFMTVYLSPRRKVILHNFLFEEKVQEGFELLPYQSQEQLGKILTHLILEDDPLWLYGHNLMKFDQLKLRDLTQTYFPAANAHYPVTKTVQGLGRVITKGRFTLDSYQYHRNFRNYHEDNTLETVAEDFVKSLDYGEQAQLVVQARKGDGEAFRKLVHYCLEDGLVTLRKGEDLKETVARKAVYLRNHPDTICTASRSTLSRNYWRRRHFLVKGTYEEGWKGWWELEDSFSLEKLKGQFLKKHFQQGFFPEAHLVYLTPFLAVARGLAERKEEERFWRYMCLLEKPDQELLELARKSTNPEGKVDLLQTVNTKLLSVVEELHKILQKEGNDLNLPPSALSEFQDRAMHAFCSARGQSTAKVKRFLYALPEIIRKTNQALEKYSVLNQGNYFHVLVGELDWKKMEEASYGCSLGCGPVLSLARERFIANPLNVKDIDKFFYQGISLRRGKKSNFERRVLEEVITRIFRGESFRETKDYLDQEISCFIRGKSAQEDYFIVQKRRTYFKNLLEEVLGNSGSEKEQLSEYHQLKGNIGERYSEETRKKLRELLSHYQSKFSFPFMEEALEEIECPFPEAIELISPEGFPATREYQQLLLPAAYGFSPNLGWYEQKVREQLKDLYSVLEKNAKKTKVGKALPLQEKKRLLPELFPR